TLRLVIDLSPELRPRLKRLLSRGHVNPDHERIVVHAFAIKLEQDPVFRRELLKAHSGGKVHMLKSKPGDKYQLIANHVSTLLGYKVSRGKVKTILSQPLRLNTP